MSPHPSTDCDVQADGYVLNHIRQTSNTRHTKLLTYILLTIRCGSQLTLPVPLQCKQRCLRVPGSTFSPLHVGQSSTTLTVMGLLHPLTACRNVRSNVTWDMHTTVYRHARMHACTHVHIHNRLTAPWTLSRITRVSWYQKGKTNLDFAEARDSEWQWHQLGHMQICTSPQTDNHMSTRPLSFFGWMPNQQRQSTEGHTAVYRKNYKESKNK